MGIMRSTLLWGSQNQTLRETLPRYRFVQKAVRRFMPGEDLEAALRAATALQESGIKAIFTHLGENVINEAEANAVAEHYLDLLDQVSARSLDCHVSVKLTQLGLDISRELCHANLLAIVERAAKLQNFVWIDMESTAYTDVTIELFRQGRAKYTNLGICLQSYLHRTMKDLQDLLPLSPAIRLVKGAYAEPPDLAFQEKREVDQNFVELTLFYLCNISREKINFGYGTHDVRLIRQIHAEVEKLGLGKEAPEFQMLYGIQREQQLRLAREGYKTRVLIAYGSCWFSWYMRRLAERPANVLFVLKNIFT